MIQLPKTRPQRALPAQPKAVTRLSARIVGGEEIKQPLNGLRGLVLWRRDPSVSFHPALEPLFRELNLADDREEPVLIPGNWNGHKLTLAALEQMVETYNPAAQPAPIKRTHDDKGAPLGWVSSIRIGDYTPPGKAKSVKALFAKFPMTPALRTAIQDGYRMKSIEAWPPGHTNNPSHGKWHFKGFAALGSESPACPNLSPLQLSDEGSEVEVPVVSLAEDPDPATGAAPAPSEKGAAMELTPAQEAALKEAADLKKKNEELEAKLADQTRQAEAKETASRLEGLVKDHKLTPAQAKVLAPVALALDSAAATVVLADNTTATPREALFKVLDGLKTHGLGKAAGIPGDAPVELGDKEKSKKKALEEKVAAYKAQGKSMAEALRMATREVEAADDMES